MTDKVFSLNLSQVKWLLISSYLIALIIDNMISLTFANHFMPPITFLLLLFWVTQILDQTHLFTAFILGLLFDAAQSTPLGSHALIFITLTFVMLRARQRFKSYPRWQQALMAGSYILVFQVLGWFIFTPTLTGNQLIYYWLEPFIAALLWPILSLMMQNSTHRFAY